MLHRRKMGLASDPGWQSLGKVASLNFPRPLCHCLHRLHMCAVWSMCVGGTAPVDRYFAGEAATSGSSCVGRVPCASVLLVGGPHLLVGQMSAHDAWAPPRPGVAYDVADADKLIRGPVVQRTCTDVPCAAVFGLYLLGFFYLCFGLHKYSDPADVMAGRDYRGRPPGRSLSHPQRRMCRATHL